MNSNNDNWLKLAAAARGSKPVEPAPPAPRDLAGKIVGLKDSIIALSRMLFWRRWSVWVALACALALLVLYLAFKAAGPGVPLIDIPNPPPTPAPSR